jgi:hypothetical protein
VAHPISGETILRLFLLTAVFLLKQYREINALIVSVSTASAE